MWQFFELTQEIANLQYNALFRVMNKCRVDQIDWDAIRAEVKV